MGWKDSARSSSDSAVLDASSSSGSLETPPSLSVMMTGVVTAFSAGALLAVADAILGISGPAEEKQEKIIRRGMGGGALTLGLYLLVPKFVRQYYLLGSSMA